MDKIGDRIALLRKQKGWSQSELAKQINASREAIGKYERNEATPAYNKDAAKRLKEIDLLKPEEKQHLYAILDAYLRDANTRRAYTK